jgi:hypothetical protein
LLVSGYGRSSQTRLRLGAVDVGAKLRRIHQNLGRRSQYFHESAVASSFFNCPRATYVSRIYSIVVCGIEAARSSRYGVIYECPAASWCK